MNHALASTDVGARMNTLSITLRDTPSVPVQLCVGSAGARRVQMAAPVQRLYRVSEDYDYCAALHAKCTLSLKTACTCVLQLLLE